MHILQGWSNWLCHWVWGMCIHFVVQIPKICFMESKAQIEWMKAAMAMVSGKIINDNMCYWYNSIQAEEALAAGEVPVGCVFIRDHTIIAKARNRTNELQNVGALCLPYTVIQTEECDTHLGNSACRTRGDWLHSGQQITHTYCKSTSIIRHHFIRNCRALHDVCICTSSTWNQRCLLWMQQ